MLETKQAKPAAKAKAPAPPAAGAARAITQPGWLQFALAPPAGDPLEREADAVADNVVRAPPAGSTIAPRLQRCAACGGDDVVMTKGLCESCAAAQSPTRALATLSRPGEPLADDVRGDFESRFQTDFASVRIHRDSEAAGDARALNARAFTYGANIGFGSGQYDPSSAPGRRLLAHELTHVVQQGAAPPSPAVAARTGSRPQRQSLLDDALNVAGGVVSVGVDIVSSGARTVAGVVEAGVETVAGGVRAAGGMLAGAAMALLRRLVPELADLVEMGPAAFVRRAIDRVVHSWLGGLIGRIDLMGAIETVRESFTNAVAGLQALLRGDADACRAFAQTLGTLREVAEAFLDNPGLNALREALATVTDVIRRILSVVLTPVFDGLREILGGAWSVISGIASTVWGWIRRARELASEAWAAVSHALGLDGESEDGVFAWLRRQLNAQWESTRATFAPIAGPLRTVGTIMLALSPIGPVYVLIRYGPRIVAAVRWLWAHRNDPDIIRSAHAEMGDSILPELLESVRDFRGSLVSAADWLLEKLESLVGSLLELAGGITGVPLLELAHSFVQSLVQAGRRAIDWARNGLQRIAAGVTAAVQKARDFVEPYREVLSSIGLAILDPPMIPVILAGWAWRRLPRCLKAPIVDFLLDIIIRALAAMPDLAFFGPLWDLLKSGVLGFLRGLRTQTAEAKEAVSDRLAKIMSGASPAFILGFVTGFLRGVWEGLTDPIRAIWMVVEGLNTVLDFLTGLASRALGLPAEAAAAGRGVATGAAPAATAAAVGAPRPAPAAAVAVPPPSAPAATPQPAPALAAPSAAPPVAASRPPAPQAEADLGGRVVAMAQELEPPIHTVTGGFWEAAQEYFSGSGSVTFDDLLTRLGEAWTSMRRAIERAAGSLANTVTQFFMRDEAEGEMGDGIGWLTGTIAFQAALEAITAGTWTAVGPTIQMIARFINWPMEVMGEAFKLLGKLGGFLVDGIRGLGRMVREAGSGALRTVVEAVETVGRKLVTFAEELVGRFGSGAAREAESVAGREAESLAGREAESVAGREAETAAQRETESAAEREAAEATEREGGAAERDAAAEATERPRAVAEARAIEAAMQAASAPVPALVAALDALKAQYRWIQRFEAVREGAGYYVWMIASRTPVGFYDPRAWRDYFEERHPGTTSTTTPPPTGKNVGLANQHHPVSGVPFDERGFPVFDRVASFDTRLPAHTAADADRLLHFEEATAQLHGAIQRGEVDAARFTQEELAAIARGETKIPNWTWHHHQDFGRMQLIPTTIHVQTGHVGGFRMWYGY